MSLHFATVQIVAGAVFAALVAVIVTVFVLVALKSRADVPYERVQGSGYWFRKRWLGFLTAAIVCVLGISFFELPYASGTAPGARVVRVTGGQFFWSLVPDNVPAGPVRFDVTSVDVNHGFGVYDPHGHLLGSVQAMPSYHNKLDLTLDETGRYVIRCMEFCGLSHAHMQAFFTVARR
jgi:cytochrome c oxidase subunit 2